MTVRAQSAAVSRSHKSRTLKNKLKAWRAAVAHFEPLESRWLMSTLDITSSALTYDGTGAASAVTISAAGSTETVNETGSIITLTANAISAGWSGGGTNTVTGPTSSFASLHVTTSSTLGQSLTLDFSGADPLPASGLTFNPTAAIGGASNTLTLKGGSFTSETYAPTTSFNGNITYSDSTNTNAVINFSNLAPVNDTATAANFTFTAPAGATAVNLINGSVVGGSQTEQINDNGTSAFDSVNFANKANVTLNVQNANATTTANATTAAAGLATLAINSAAGGDTITINNTPNALTMSAAALGAITVNGTGSAGTLTLNTAIGADSAVNIVAENEPVSLNLNANATVSIGSTGGNGSVAGVLGSINIANLPSFYTLAFHDESDVTGHTWTVNDDDTSNLANVAISSGTTISYKPSDVSAFTINAGSGGNTFHLNALTGFITSNINTGAGNDNVTVSATNGNTLNLNGQGGNDTVTFGGVASAGMSHITGFIHVTNASGNTSLVLDDSEDSTGRTAVLTDPGVNGIITGPSLSNIEYADSDVHSVSVLLGSGNNTFTAQGNLAPVSVTSNGGHDTVVVDAQTLAPTVTAGGSANQVVVALAGHGNVTTSGVATVSLTDTPALTITSGASQSINAVEGTPLTGTVVGSFSVPITATIGGNSTLALPASAFTSSVNFHDPSSDAAAGTITQNPNTDQYSVSANHTFASAGNFTVTSSVTLAATTFSSTLNGVAISIPIAAVSSQVLTPATALISQGAIFVTALPLTGTANVTIPSAPIATFTQVGTHEPAGNYAASITITDSSNNTVLATVASSITFSNTTQTYTVNAPAITLPIGSYNVNVAVTEIPTSTVASNASTITIADAPLTAGSAIALNSTFNVPLTSAIVGTFTSRRPHRLGQQFHRSNHLG